MAQVFFTAHLRSVVDTSPLDAAGDAVGEALNDVFRRHPGLKGYVLDEQGALRRHICIFLDGNRLLNPTALAAPVNASSEIYVLQALSGG